MTTIDERRVELVNDLLEVQQQISELADGERINALLGEIADTGSVVTVEGRAIRPEEVYTAIQVAADRLKHLYSEGWIIAHLLWNFEYEWGMSGEDF